jgi:hypothetical protein
VAPALFGDVVRFCILLNAELCCSFSACLGYFGEILSPECRIH